MGKAKKNEFPMLEELGLYATPTTGYGNCLFAALSDQVYGDETHHLEIRARVVDFMWLNGAYFKPFLPVNVGGGERRNSRRSTAGRYAATYDLHEPTEAETNQQYELKLQNLAQPNEYGDHLAILAFSGQYGVTVKVHQAQTACEEVSAAGLSLEGATEAASDPLVAHIAYHSHEHYSSVRPIDNQHQGLTMTATSVTASGKGKEKEIAPFVSDDDSAAPPSPSGSSQRGRSASISSASDGPATARPTLKKKESSKSWVVEKRKHRRAKRKAARKHREASQAAFTAGLDDLHI